MLVKGFLPDVSDGARGGEPYEQVLGPRWWSQVLRLYSSAAPTGGLEGMQTGMKSMLIIEKFILPAVRCQSCGTSWLKMRFGEANLERKV